MEGEGRERGREHLYNLYFPTDNNTTCMSQEGRRECWNEKVESRKGSVVEKVLTGKGVGKRPRGRLRKRWRDLF